MGTFRVALQVGNPDRGITETVDALVDTGATFSMMPASMLKRMGVEPDATLPFRVATREVVDYATGEVPLGTHGRRRACPVIFGPENHYIMGATAMELLLLTVDPVHQRLVPIAGEA